MDTTRGAWLSKSSAASNMPSLRGCENIEFRSESFFTASQ
jgi:hypothetical protein